MDKRIKWQTRSMPWILVFSRLRGLKFGLQAHQAEWEKQIYNGDFTTVKTNKQKNKLNRHDLDSRVSLFSTASCGMMLSFQTRVFERNL